eukprot:CAMPEP_0117502926 /NCGR_PEP_ID=MMETSP0784-20121206/24063_1 /TAXON_ID=39447 /ORGANISM="" /LENGTH=328 /DNA_ID=CAMNT_0005298221 /DNA_START=135 /DNA_END=1117 /DNA_ORIENTATION=+
MDWVGDSGCLPHDAVLAAILSFIKPHHWGSVRSANRFLSRCSVRLVEQHYSAELRQAIDQVRTRDDRERFEAHEIASPLDPFLAIHVQSYLWSTGELQYDQHHACLHLADVLGSRPAPWDAAQIGEDGEREMPAAALFAVLQEAAFARYNGDMLDCIIARLNPALGAPMACALGRELPRTIEMDLRSLFDNQYRWAKIVVSMLGSSASETSLCSGLVSDCVSRLDSMLGISSTDETPSLSRVAMVRAVGACGPEAVLNAYTACLEGVRTLPCGIQNFSCTDPVANAIAVDVSAYLSARMPSAVEALRRQLFELASFDKRPCNACFRIR